MKESISAKEKTTSTTLPSSRTKRALSTFFARLPKTPLDNRLASTHFPLPSPSTPPRRSRYITHAETFLHRWHSDEKGGAATPQRRLNLVEPRPLFLPLLHILPSHQTMEAAVQVNQDRRVAVSQVVTLSRPLVGEQVLVVDSIESVSDKAMNESQQEWRWVVDYCVHLALEEKERRDTDRESNDRRYGESDGETEEEKFQQIISLPVCATTNLEDQSEVSGVRSAFDVMLESLSGRRHRGYSTLRRKLHRLSSRLTLSNDS